MTTAALVWTDGSGLRLAELPPDRAVDVGRSAQSGIVVDDATVSRRHFRVSLVAGSFLLENLSQTNVTKLRDAPLTAPVRLTDGDPIQAGMVRLTFHDLASGDRFSGPLCSHCGRENASGERDCWYCGTSLVNAPTTIRQRKLVGCRVVSADGQRRDLYAGERVIVRPGGVLDTDPIAQQLPPDALAAIELPAESGGGVPRPVHRATAAAAVVNGAPVADGQPVVSGDLIETGGIRVIAAVR